MASYPPPHNGVLRASEIMATKNQIAKSYQVTAERAARGAYVNAMLKQFLQGANDETMRAELYAFLDDTKNCSQKIIFAADTRINDNGQLVERDENGNEQVVEGAAHWVSVNWKQDKNGNITLREVFRAPYPNDTWQRINSIICSWVSYRETVPDSFLAIRERMTAKINAKLLPLREQAETFTKYNVPIPDVLAEQISELENKLQNLLGEINVKKVEKETEKESKK